MASLSFFVWFDSFAVSRKSSFPPSARSLLSLDRNRMLDGDKRLFNGGCQRGTNLFGQIGRCVRIGGAFGAVEQFLDLAGFIILFGDDRFVHFGEGVAERIFREFFC